MTRSSQSFLNLLEEANIESRNYLKKLLPQNTDIKIKAAMNYAVLNGGKGLRSFLALESSALCGAPKIQALQAAAAIECIHSYSLVHDDLPAMDNDDLRRGKPTVHKKWDEATAILTGDALQTLSFQLLSDPRFKVGDDCKLNLVYELSVASGAEGMVLGQALDILAETADAPLKLDDIVRMQRMKTGALIEWSACHCPSWHLSL